MDCPPGFARRFGDWPGVLGWPCAVAFEMCPSPLSDLGNRDRRQMQMRADAALIRKEQRERHSTRQSALCRAQRKVDRIPALAGGRR